jgi:hypothetical protein
MLSFDFFLLFLLFLNLNLIKIVSLPRAWMVGSRQWTDLAHHQPITAHWPVKKATTPPNPYPPSLPSLLPTDATTSLSLARLLLSL